MHLEKLHLYVDLNFSNASSLDVETCFLGEKLYLYIYIYIKEQLESPLLFIFKREKNIRNKTPKKMTH